MPKRQRGISTNWLNLMKTTQTLLTDLFNKPFIGLDEVSDLLGVPKRTLQQSVYFGRFEVPTFTLGKKRMMRLSDLAAYVDEQCALSAAEIKELN
jgi:hypothetical protein